MKETLLSRHHSTVLPRLGSSRMESHQNLHTHAVDSAIQPQGNNRVLKKRPSPISDEEQRLNRRQLCTLSQLRKQSDSSRCPDCGMEPQDVPHLFDCMTHPNDLSPVNLCDKPIETIREFSFLDPGNLNRMVEEGIQQQQLLRSGHYHLLHHYKHRVLGEPTDICTDCGASPQDVRHLFACTTHPTDLSPRDLWRNSMGSIRTFSYLDNGNLD